MQNKSTNSNTEQYIYIYILFSIIEVAIRLVFPTQVVDTVTYIDFLKIPIKPVDVLWYIYVLSMFYAVAYFTYKIHDVVLLVIAFGMCFAGQYFKIQLFALSSFMFYYIYFFLGVLLSKYSILYSFDKAKPVYVGMLYALSVFLLSTIWFFVNIFTIKFIGILAKIIVIVSVLLFFYRSKWIGNSTVLISCGRHSLEIYLMHSYLITLCAMIIPKLNLNNFPLYFAVGVLTAILIPVGCAALLKKLGIYNFVFMPVKCLSERIHK